MLSTILDIYYRFLRTLLTIMLALLLVPVTLQVVARYVDFVPRYIWTEEISRFAFIWVILLGSIIAIRDNTHFTVDVLPRFGPRVERFLHLVTLVAMVVAGIVFAYGGILFAQFGARQTSELAGLPMLTIYIAWPILGFSWLLFMVEKIAEFRSSRPAD